MRSAPLDLGESAVRVDALFASALQRSDEPSALQVRQAVAAATREFGGLGCAARVAQEYGEHPETAVRRMRWARTAVAGAYGGPPGHGRATGSARCPAPARRAVAGLHAGGGVAVRLHREPPAAGQDVERQLVTDRDDEPAVVGRMRRGGVTRRASTAGLTIGPPAEKLYAVESAGVATTIASAA